MTKPPDKNPREQLREFVQGAFVRVFCTRPTKNRGGPRCGTYFWGVPGWVTKGDRGRVSKLAKNSVTYFMDGPFGDYNGEVFSEIGLSRFPCRMHATDPYTNTPGCT